MINPIRFNMIQQTIDFEDFNKQLKVAKQREDNYIQLLERFKLRRPNSLFTENDFKIYSSIH